MRSVPARAFAILFMGMCVTAQAQEPAASESRDAATGYVGTITYIVGRIASECLQPMGRTQTAQQFVASWQQRNARYVLPAAAYLQKRVQEAVATGGQAAQETILRELRSGAQSSGEPVIRGWFEKDGKEAACKRAVGLIEAGGLDIGPSAPLYTELESLAAWAKQ